MPYATGTTPFTGDNDMTDFMTNVYVPFARDDCKWSDNQAPASSPSNRFWLHRVSRGGSPTAPLSPFTPEPPFVFYETGAKTMAHFTGDDIDTSLESWQQPNNPNNYWDVGVVDAATDLSSRTYINGRGILTNAIVGTFQKYWLFSDEEGRYIHCVIQPRAREYRHFHVGLLDGLHPEFPAGSFYVTGHFWDSLYDNITSDSNVQDNEYEHWPYYMGRRDGGHRVCFHNQAEGSETFGLPKTDWVGTLIYIPGYTTEDWFRPTEVSTLTTPRGTLAASRGSPDLTYPSNYGVFNSNYSGGAGLGTLLFNADKTFTSNTNSLVPIYIAVNVSFASANRWGVVAQVPDMFRINMRDYSAGEEISVGSDTYVVFPLINKDSANVLDGEGYSGYEGIAYKKITATVP